MRKAALLALSFMLLSTTFSAIAADPTTEAAAPAATQSADANEGKAARYTDRLNGHRTASGARYNKHAMTAAHASLPFGTRVKVTNTANKRSVVVTINDRLAPQGGRILDLSRAAAQKLHMMKVGVADVKMQVLGKGKARHVAKHHPKKHARKHA